MSHIEQTIREAEARQRTLAGDDALIASMVATLERTLPPDIKAQCDAALGADATPHQRWTMYFTAERHYCHKAEIESIESEIFNDDHSDPHLHRAE